MALLGLKQLLLSLMFLFGCSGGPDEFSVGYGHTFMGDSRFGDHELTNDDNDSVFGSFTWYLRPRSVVITPNIEMPPLHWRLTPQEPDKPSKVPALRNGDLAPPKEGVKVAEDAMGILERFDKLNWWLVVAVVLLCGWIAWVYRRQLGRLIPGGKNGNSDKKT